MNENDIKDILEKIALPCRDDGVEFTDTQRLDAIAECLSGRWRLLADRRLAKIYARPDFGRMRGPVVVVSSRVSTAIGRCHVDCGGGLWRGDLDNLATNAVIVAVMLKMGFKPNVLVAFTGGGETGNEGASDVDNALRCRGMGASFVICTNVTDAGWEEGKHFVIENVFPNDERSVSGFRSIFLPELVGIDGQPAMSVDAGHGEALKYNEHKYKCCTISLPSNGDAHLEEGVSVRAKSVAIYADVVSLVANTASKALVPPWGMITGMGELARYYDLRKKALGGDTAAQYTLGYEADCSSSCVGRAEAEMWYRMAAERGHVDAQLHLGGLYEKQFRKHKAVKWFLRAVEQGSVYAQNALGNLYSADGNYTEAVKWYRKAAMQSENEGAAAYAQIRLGNIYEVGVDNVDRDYVEAVKWYRKAAKHYLRYLDPAHRLGVMYENGFGVAQDDVEAAKWYRKAARRGCVRAEEALCELRQKRKHK